jgi:VWFA-related protein
MQAAQVAQNPPDAPPPATFQTSTQLMQVRVIAEDKDGKPVTDLRQEEFQLVDNGLSPEIRLLLNESERTSFARPPLPPGTFTNRGESRPGGHSGYSVIVVDTLLTLLADENQGGSGAIWAIRKAITATRSLPPGENVAIYATGYKLWVIREFTQDRDSLVEKLRKWKPTMDVLPDEVKVNVLRQEIEQIAGHVAAIPGRKNLILGRVPVSDRSAGGAEAQDGGCRGLSGGCARLRHRVQERRRPSRVAAAGARRRDRRSRLFSTAMIWK